MSTTTILLKSLAVGAALAVLSTASVPFVAPAHAETAVKPEKNPPGDIPDTQVFVTFTSDGGYSLKVPEGWARTDTGTGAQFVDKLDAVSVTLTPLDSVPSVDWVKAHYLPQMQQAGRAVKVIAVQVVDLSSGPAIQIAYSANSDPNPVTAKQVRLEGIRYLIWHKGALVALDVTAPLGADNVDQWKLMSNSFGWK